MFRTLRLVLGRIAFWGAWPFWKIILGKSRRTRVLVVCGNEILMERGTLSAGLWSLPGGGLFKDEAPEYAAARELWEETGISVPASEIEVLAEEPTTNDGGLGFTCIYAVVRLLEKPVTTMSWELIDLQWVRIDDLDHYNTQPLVGRALELYMTM